MKNKSLSMIQEYKGRIVLSFSILCAVLFVCIAFTGCSLDVNVSAWNNNSKALSEIKTYVTDISNKSSENYIPEEDRIAIFDMDGTVFSEKNPLAQLYGFFAYRVKYDPTYTCTDSELISIANKIENAANNNETDESLWSSVSTIFFKPFIGLTLEQYQDCIERYSNCDSPYYSNAKNKDLYFLPMQQIMQYLNQNGFTCYISTGSDREFARGILGYSMPVNKNHILGSDINFKASNQGNVNDIKYQFNNASDSLILQDGTTGTNLSENKVSGIAKEIGKIPVLAFGNGATDVAMLNYTLSNKKYKTMSFMLLQDNDTSQIKVDTQTSAKLKAVSSKSGYNTISVNDDFNQLFSDGIEVKK